MRTNVVIISCRSTMPEAAAPDDSLSSVSMSGPPMVELARNAPFFLLAPASKNTSLKHGTADADHSEQACCTHSHITSMYTAYTLFHVNQNRHVLHIYRHISNITSMQTVQASVPHRSEHASTFTDTANISLQYKQACCTHSYIHHKFNRSMHSAQANAHSTHSNTHHKHIGSRYTVQTPVQNHSRHEAHFVHSYTHSKHTSSMYTTLTQQCTVHNSISLHILHCTAVYRIVF